MKLPGDAVASFVADGERTVFKSWAPECHECQKVKNGGLDQYGAEHSEVWPFDTTAWAWTGYTTSVVLRVSVYGRGCKWESVRCWCLCRVYRGRVHQMWVGVLFALPSGAVVALAILAGNAESLVGVAISSALLEPSVNAVCTACTELPTYSSRLL